MKPLITDEYPVEFGRFRDIFDPEVYDTDFNLYKDSCDPQLMAIMGNFTEQDKKDYYNFFLLLRAAHAGIAATVRRPQKLVIHGFKECHLKCSYCIVEANQPGASTEHLNLDVIKQLRDTYAINSVHFVGGEPTYDWDQLYRCLDILGPMLNVSLTTNGLGLTQRHLDEMDRRCQDVSYHVSVEPQSWGQRMFTDGVTHQNVALKRVFEKLNPEQVFRSKTSCLNVVLPMDFKSASGIETKMDVDAIVDELSDVVNYRDWMGIWHVEFAMEGNKTRPLDDWIYRLLVDESAKAASGTMTKQRFLNGPIGEMAYRMINVNNTNKYPGKFFSCAVGGSSIHVSFNGKLYGCSVEAGRGEGERPIDPLTYGPADKWASLCDVMPALTYDACRACPAKFFCGKTCGKLNVAGCEYNRIRAELLPRVLKRFHPEEYEAVRRAQERYIYAYTQHRDLIRHVLADPWTQQFIHGQTNDLEKVREASDALGVLLS